MKNYESLFAAYLLVWAIFFVYEISVGRRLAALQDEVARLSQELAERVKGASLR